MGQDKILRGGGKTPSFRPAPLPSLYFYNDEGDGEVKMCLMEVKGEHLKGGLIVEGIELRPKE